MRSEVGYFNVLKCQETCDMVDILQRVVHTMSSSNKGHGNNILTTLARKKRSFPPSSHNGPIFHMLVDYSVHEA